MRYNNYFVEKIVVAVLLAVQVPEPDGFPSHLLVLLFVVLVVTAAVVLVFGRRDTGHRGSGRGADRGPGRQPRWPGPVVQAHPVVQELVQPWVPVTAGGPVMAVHPLAQRARADRQQRGERQHPRGHGRCGLQHVRPKWRARQEFKVGDCCRVVARVLRLRRYRGGSKKKKNNPFFDGDAR